MMKRSIFSRIWIFLPLFVVAMYILFPIAFLVINSFKGDAEIIENPLSWPKNWNFEYIINAANKIHFFKAFCITAVITCVSVALIVFISSLAAWVMVRRKTIWSKILFFAFTAAMLVPFQSIMYPLISEFSSMHLKNTTGLILMYGGFGLSLSVFLYHGFIKSIPKSIEEAAIIDGASMFRTFFTIVFPLLKPITVSVVILNSIWIWNDYLLPFLVIGEGSSKTLVLELYYARMLSDTYTTSYQLIFPAVLITIVPVIIAFLFLQKYFIKGISSGAVK